MGRPSQQKTFLCEDELQPMFLFLIDLRMIEVFTLVEKCRIVRCKLELRRSVYPLEYPSEIFHEAPTEVF